MNKYENMPTDTLVEIRELKMKLHRKFLSYPERYSKYRGRHLKDAKEIDRILLTRENL